VRRFAITTAKLVAIVVLPGGLLVAFAWWAQKRRERRR
jgi:hypothetical protein